MTLRFGDIVVIAAVVAIVLWWLKRDRGCGCKEAPAKAPPQPMKPQPAKPRTGCRGGLVPC